MTTIRYYNDENIPATIKDINGTVVEFTKVSSYTRAKITSSKIVKHNSTDKYDDFIYEYNYVANL